MKRLIRNKRKAVFGGVCAGFADYTDIDLSLIRIGVVLISIFTAILPAVIFYIAAWIIIPEE